jgi:hypothetical protein
MEAPDSKPVKDSDRKELDKLREMNRKEKLSHIWEYYKYYIIGIAIAMAVFWMLLYTIVINPGPEPALYISWNAGIATNEQIDDLKNHLERYLVDEGVNEEVVMSIFFFDENIPETTMIGHQHIIAMIAAGIIDLFIMGDELMKEYSLNGLLLPLENILEEIYKRNPELYNRITEQTVYELFEVGGNVFDKRVVAIEIGRSPLFSKLGFFEQDLYLCVAVSTRNIENVLKTIILFFE